MRTFASIVALFLVPVLEARADVTVRVADGLAQVVANRASLGEVLDAMARETGMKVIYNGEKPRQGVTVSLSGTPAEVVHELLKARKLNYAVAVQAGGRVQTLILTSASAPVDPKPASATTPAAPDPSALEGATSAEEVIKILGGAPDEAAADETSEKPPDATPDVIPPAIAEILGVAGRPVSETPVIDPTTLPRLPNGDPLLPFLVPPSPVPSPPAPKQ
jgi:hypothetical protein